MQELKTFLLENYYKGNSQAKELYDRLNRDNFETRVIPNEREVILLEISKFLLSVLDQDNASIEVLSKTLNSHSALQRAINDYRRQTKEILTKNKRVNLKKLSRSSNYYWDYKNLLKETLGFKLKEII